jgi:FixJ family two-component response regulator
MNQISIQHAEKLPPIVYVIDDDASMRAALSSLIRSVGLRVEVFASAPDFLATKRTDGPNRR